MGKAKRKKLPPKPPPAPKPRPVDMVLKEQRDKGVWAEAKGFDMRDKPVINLAEDMIGRLASDGLISLRQLDAARQWQQVWADYRDELGTQGYVSCLVERTGGFDGSDGNPAAIRAYRRFCDKIGRIKVATLKLECDKGRDDKPRDLQVLKNALDCIGA